MENNLANDISIENVSSHVFMSASHFQRIFYVVTGITVGDYIRNRRLSLAGLDLLLTKSKVIDIAMRYQYDTSESFSKAFTRFHGISPSVVKKHEDKLKCFDPIVINIYIQGGFNMSRKMEQTILRKHNYILEDKNIKLRPMLEDDFNIMIKWNSDLEVLYYSEGDDVQEPHSVDDIKDIYKTAPNAFCFIIEYENKPIGECWVQKNNHQYLIDEYPDADSRRIDIVIGEKEYWGKGIGTICVRLLTQFGFEIEKADMIFYIPMDYNVRSCKTAERVGYKLLSKTEVKDNPKTKFELNYGMTKEDYFSMNPR